MSRSVQRAADILNVIAAEPQTVAALAAQFGTHRSTMFRELQTLERVGFARRLPDGTFVPAFRLAALGAAALEHLDLRAAGFGHVRRLHRVTGGTVHVAALVDDAIVYVDKAEDAEGVRMYSRVGSLVRPQCSALGKAILAFSNPERRDAVLADVTWPRYTAQTITSRAALDAELEVIGRRGWADDDGEFEDFVACVAVPVLSSAGVVGALSLTTLKAVQTLDRLRTRIPLLRETAALISSDLG